MKRFLGSFVLLSVMHCTVQWALWQTQALRLAMALPIELSWRYMSFPLFWFVPTTMTQGSYWLVGPLNSALRGLASTSVLWFTAKRLSLRGRAS